MIVADTSTLIILGRLNRLDILQVLFGEVYIPKTVYEEAVENTKWEEQKRSILIAIQDKVILIGDDYLPDVSLRRRLGEGEKGVLLLALARRADAVILDDKKAANEAREMGLFVIDTAQILRIATQRNLIASYEDVLAALAEMGIYLPR